MSFFDCVADAVDEGSIDKGRGERAQAMWKDLSGKYERQGHPRHTAEAMAAEDVKAAFRREAGEVRHVALSKMAAVRKMQAEVNAAKAPDMVSSVERLDYRHRGLVRRFQGRVGEFLREHHRDILGRVTNKAGMVDVVRELHGEATGNVTARALADGVRAALEDMRLMFNEAGGLAGKLDDWGLPHAHNRAAVTKAGFDRWFSEVSPRLNWSRMEDRLTGKPFQAEGGAPPSPEVQRAVLKEAWDNIAFGKSSTEAVYGRPKGVATYRKHSEQRVLIFKSADDWMAYNRDFGTVDAFKSLMGHVHRMARDITLMREFGPNPALGAEYKAQLWEKRAKDAGDANLSAKVEADSKRGLRMFKVMSGGRSSESAIQDWIATFMSSTRHVLTSAFLDRAIIASASDLNTMRLAAQSIGMNPANLISKQVGALQSLSKDELLRAGWVADTMADAGTALARFQQDVAPSDIAERLSSASMRVQGLSQWTDRARATFYQDMSGYLASEAHKPMDQLFPALRTLLERHGVTPDDWAMFTKADHLFTADNGATFAMPIYWREATDLPENVADDIFFKMQGAIEEQMELAVPTGSLYARSFVDPAAFDLPPGTLLYELAKSGLMFKSFAMTFTVNQHRQIMAHGGYLSAGGAGYALNLAAGAVAMGAISTQVNEILMGRDPQDMTNPAFWARAAMKGGAFGIVGDIATTGQASWGGGFASYVAGPMPQAAQDTYDLLIKNGVEFLQGKDTNFAKEFARIGKRYTPMGQTVAIGPAMDRLLWDQLQLLLDPDSADAMLKAAQSRANAYGSGDAWLPGELSPSRLPDIGNALGQ
jgi:hypothetical protein